ncbi:TrkA family potassium uptake protein [Tropicimonas sp. TH_r6]|uniref:potassium channel family protein n=1 Tax=Tropicimonas sp. TH_r6 TaxID=3082085 RepID=UPI002953E1FC|nr:TrkA family potassium uptake protein [Tropicimonas sp. TH_r6]MDV7143158.1 TrkA family potassium uptake protein [Tropicimonas sp. TH_r6]
MPNARREFAVVGLGTFGAAVARELAHFGNPVIGIDISEQRVSALAERLDRAIIADARDEDALREAGVGECAVVVIAIGEELEANVLATMNAKMLGVPKIWAKANSRAHHRILSKLGADRVVQPEEEVGTHVAQMLNTPDIRDYLSLGNGFHIVNLQIPPGFLERDLAELQLEARHRLRCLGVMRGTEFRGDGATGCRLAEKDRMLLLGRRDDLRNFAAQL